jgi:hypothetical protein
MEHQENFSDSKKNQGKKQRKGLLHAELMAHEQFNSQAAKKDIDN